MNDDTDEFEQQIDSLEQKRHELSDAGLYRSSARIANETRRLCRAENRVMPYLSATFAVMNHGCDLMEPETARDAALELISLLESQDRARAFQADLPEDEYDEAVHWYSSCAYDNLANAIANLNGFNSEGTHDCIADGIQVCRQTGKLQCITCFREYAADVYMAADDLEMAMHYSRMGIAHDKPGPHDRRWAGAKELTEQLILAGRFQEAAHAAEQALSLVDVWHEPNVARLTSQLLQDKVALLLGEEATNADEITRQMPPEGESPFQEVRFCHVKAIQHACKSEFDEAIELLMEWDQKLTRAKSFSRWLDHRLRLLCVYRMAGRDADFERFARPLEKKAKAARDWLTLRCLKRLRDPEALVAPVPLVGDPDAGPFARTKTVASTPQNSASVAEVPSEFDGRSSKTDETEKPLPEDTGLEKEATGDESSAYDSAKEPTELIAAIIQRLQATSEEGSDETPADIQADLLQMNSTVDQPVNEVQWLLHLMTFLVNEEAKGQEIWDWGQAIAKPHQEDAVVLNLLAFLGCSVKFNDDEASHDVVDTKMLETMFRESLDRDPQSPKNFHRAGDYYSFVEDAGQAERCFARAFRLDRGNEEFAMKLSKIYRQTERERDALAVLDMCIREGGTAPELLWTAAITARQVGRHEAALTYFDAYEEVVSEQPWLNYYRAASLLELERAEEALAMADSEIKFFETKPLHIAMQQAAALSLMESEKAISCLQEALSIPMHDADDLPREGLMSIIETLWYCSARLETNPIGIDRRSESPDEKSVTALRQRLRERAIAAALASDAMFNVETQEEPQEGVNFYECVVFQPLDERWQDWHGRLPGEEDWQGYLVAYGVIAASEDEATALVLKAHSESFPLDATVTDVFLQSGGYTDHPRIVWQGYRKEAAQDS